MKSPKSILENASRSKETRAELFGHNSKNNTVHHQNNTTPTVKQAGGSIILWGFSSVSTGASVKVLRIKNRSKYQSILAENLQMPARKLKVKRNWPLYWFVESSGKLEKLQALANISVCLISVFQLLRSLKQVTFTCNTEESQWKEKQSHAGM